ncbi:inactive beta-amylase 9-like [Magnolia sinica]|uniref:inactive beta-amylase 9-like n=1 Tax=Magnolia sinica TaxID=86752 RepID=UPI002659835C|nr:inactive beta-amylase 9-like [Magnolia sinica]
MEVSVVGSSQTIVGKTESPFRNLGFSKSKQIPFRSSRIGFDPMRNCRRASIRVALKAIRSEMCRSATVAGKKATGKILREKSDNRVHLFVGLPLDCHNLQHTRAIAAGLKALKLLGVEGVDLPIWWGIVEKDTPGKYEWSNYLALAEMVRDAGLKLHVSICFHASSKDPAVPLPQWVSQVGEAQPDIFFTDRSGRRFRECLSLGVDDLPVLDGKTPVRVFEEFCESFKSSFSAFMGSTITDITVGLGPDGELRYPSFQQATGHQSMGVGEFQCYDKHLLNHLKQQASSIGHSNWGLSGPHDAPQYDGSPDSHNFIRESGGSWDTPYGEFFLSWYSNQLLSHGNRLLSLASSVFADSNITVSGKVPVMHSYYRTRSHPSELTAGYYNTVHRDGYNAVAEMFARNHCKMIIPSMELSDEHQPNGLRSSPDSLLSQIMAACKMHGVGVTGENSSKSSIPGGFDKIKERILSSSSENVMVDSFMYQRMGAYFFSPEHFPMFTKFVRSLDQVELHSDDLPDLNEEAMVSSITTGSELVNDLQRQAV